MRYEEANDLMQIAINSESTNNLLRSGIEHFSKMALSFAEFQKCELDNLKTITDQLSIISTTLMNISDRLKELEGKYE